MGFLSTLLGVKDDVTAAEVAKLAQRSRFSEYLPWVAYDPKEKVYYNSDDSQGFLWEISPLCFQSSKTADILEGLFRMGLPEKSVMQFILYADKDIEPFLEMAKRAKVRDLPITRHVTESVADFFRMGVTGMPNLNGVPVRNYRAFVAIKVPDDAKINIKEIQSLAQEILHGAGLNPVFMPPEVLLDWSRRLLNDRVADGPAGDNPRWDYYIPLRKQVVLGDTEISVEKERLKIGKKTFRCVSPKAYPEHVDTLQSNRLIGGNDGVRSDGDQINTPFLYSVNIVFQNMRNDIHKKTSFVLWQQGVGSFAPSLARRQDEYQWAADCIEKGTPFFRVIPSFWLFGEDESRTVDAVSRVKRMWESEGYIMQEDHMILPALFLASLPFGLFMDLKSITALERDFIAPADAITRVLPAQADFSGFGRTPQMLFVGRKGQLVGMDIFDKGANNHNVLVAAESGAGKSFFVNYLTGNYFGSGAKVRIIDIGGSYKKMVKMYDAKFLDFAPDSDICLNPFSNVQDMEHDLYVVASVIKQMIFSSTGEIEREAETSMTIIKAAVKWAYREHGPEADINDVYLYLKEFPNYAEEYDFTGESPHVVEFKKLANTMAFNLFDFTSEGPYGKWFNGKATLDIANDDFVVLELENLKAMAELFQVVVLQVINMVTADLYLSDRGQKRLIVFDEAWQFLQHDNSMICDVIQEGYRRARKYGGSFSVIVQSLLDLEMFGKVGNVLKGNSAFKFLLQSGDLATAKDRKIVDYDEFTMKVLDTLKSNRPKYSEFFAETPYGYGIARLVVDPFSYYIYTSDASEVKEIESICDEQGVSYEDAVREMVRRYRSGSAVKP